MRKFVQVALGMLLTLLMVSSEKDEDEGRPYEFGFTIDGEQHRYEKKDEKGIVQGEFGFITADGIYHVTVYATDENGNFKILSMRNIRISAPLDGSSFKGEISPEADKYRKQAGLGPLPQTPASTPNSPPLVSPVQSQITTAKQPIVFTTQATIKPGCAGCGYITTAKPTQNQKEPNSPQLPPLVQYQNQPNGIQNTQYQPITNSGGSTNPSLSAGVGSNALGPQSPFNANSPSNQPGPNQQQVPGSGIFQPGQSPQINQLPTSGGGNNVQSGQPFKVDLLPDSQKGNGVQSGQTPQSNQQRPTQNDVEQQVQDFVGIAQRPGQPSRKPSSLPPVSVSNNAIHVGGQNPQDIPIKDKFSGMQDGLPNGIEEKDITGILYKFHYTVGFHGHYEKGLKNGAKIGGYFVNGRDGISRVVTYVADENGYRPKFKFINLGLDSDETPKEATEKTFGLKSFEFVWYPIA